MRARQLRDALTGIGTPEKWLRDEKEVEAFAEEQAARQQAEQLTSQVASAAEAGKSLGEAQQALQSAA